jgi:guanosine-3',5'-bis(diphosphate) 3'-pyrophosphohydrolase
MAQRSLTAWFTLPGLREKAPPTPAEAASFDALAPKLGYLSKAEVKRVREAYKFADEATWARNARPASPTSPTPSPSPASAPNGGWTRRR